MKKFLLVFLLLVLPFQMSWATVSAYCQHEKGAAAKHFGHHDHQHQAQNDDDSKDGPLVKIDKDCMYCHLSHVSIFTSSFVTPAVAPASMPAFADGYSIAFNPPDRPERPKWMLAI